MPVGCENIRSLLKSYLATWVMMSGLHAAGRDLSCKPKVLPRDVKKRLCKSDPNFPWLKLCWKTLSETKSLEEET